MVLYIGGAVKKNIDNRQQTDEQASLRLCCSQTPEDRFSRAEAHKATCNFPEGGSAETASPL